MGIFDSMKSRLGKDSGANEERELARAFREPSWPEGVDDFEPLANTGAFLPANYDIDPLADASLPGNQMAAASAQYQPEVPETQSVIRPAGAPLFDDGLAAEGADDMPFDADSLISMPPTSFSHSNESASNADLDAEFEERRRVRDAARQARAEESAARTSAVMAAHAERMQSYDPDVSGVVVRPRSEPAPAPARMSVPAPLSLDAPVPVPGAMGGFRGASCEIVRPRSYDDVSLIAQVIKAERRPVVLVLKACSNDLGRRIMDFAFGLCCGTGANLREFGSHVYGIFPVGTSLSDDDIQALRRQNISVRG